MNPMPTEAKRTSHLRLIPDFVRAVLNHWLAFVSSGVLAVILWWFQGVGWIAPRHWQVWAVVAIGLLAAIYQAWTDERMSVEDLNERLTGKKGEEKRELIRILSILHRFQDDVIYWRRISSGYYSEALPEAKIAPPDLATILYEADKIRPDLRELIEEAEKKATAAQSSINVFLKQNVTFRREELMKEAYRQLDEAAPKISTVITEIEAFEKSQT